jgi:hypothetical protein
MPRARSRLTPIVFAGCSVEAIARWCAVSLHTARLYQSGERKPSRQALRLFTLYRAGRVLDGQFEGFAVHRDKLVDPDGNEFDAGQLRAHWLIIQLAKDLASKDSRDLEEYWRILRAS